MKLISFKYNTDTLNIEELELDSRFNLFIGQNATGKTRVINAINRFSWLISAGPTRGNHLFMPSNSLTFEFDGIWSARFNNNNNEIIEITITVHKGLFVNEKILQNGNIIVSRNGRDTEIVYKNNMIAIHPPKEVLALHARRDVTEYASFEEIIEWSNSIRYFEFSRDYGTFSVDYTLDEILTKMNSGLKSKIIKDLQFIGFNIEDILLKDKRSSFNKGNKEVYIIEKNVLNEISEMDISQGMLRAFSMIVYVDYMLDQEAISTIIVDDLGEGLDYERATKLGKLLVEKLENSNIQFIATSNDSFLMDVVPIKYWNILQRSGNTVKSLNYQNSKQRFDKFLMTGLSNFDLFSSDYLMRPTP
jgi:AAA15 family ATPase/GTPase